MTETRPPAADQQKNEPFGTSPETSAQSGGSSQGRGDQAAPASRSAAAPIDSDVPVPADTHGVSVPPDTRGVAVPPGKPDGEVDTRA